MKKEFASENTDHVGERHVRFPLAKGYQIAPPSLSAAGQLKRQTGGRA